MVAKILTCSAIEGHGIDDVWEVLRLYTQYLDQRNLRKEDRTRQKTKWLDWSLNLTAQELLLLHPLIRQKIDSGKNDLIIEPGNAFTIEYEIENLMRTIIQQPD
jgi:LAO/AO transport system kinase